MSKVPLLIAGLGNPGQSYGRNRHNVGFMATDVIHESYEFGHGADASKELSAKERSPGEKPGCSSRRPT
jgi:peptidyl-tRNA hydrolase, PTH1 family